MHTARAQHNQAPSLGFWAIFELNQTLRFFYILILMPNLLSNFTFMKGNSVLTGTRYFNKEVGVLP